MIRRADDGEIASVQELFSEYAESLDFELCFQGFDEEVAAPLETYEAVLLATDGCVALRRVDETTCEMKRLYVRPRARGHGLGRRLVVELISEAHCLGFQRVLLDTRANMVTALGLYRSLGFRTRSPYRDNPFADALFFERDLDTPGGR